MKAINFLLIALLLSSCNNAKKESARESAGLRGLVKKVISIDYDAIDRFGEGEIITTKPQAFGSNIIVYDSLGNIINKRDFYFRERTISSEMFLNEKRQWTKWISYDDTEKVEFSKSFEYNEQGDKIKEIDLLDGDIENIKIKYNEQGQKIYEKNDLYTTTYKYDGKNLIEKIATWRIGYFSTVYIRKYKYNEQNNLVEETEYNDGKLEEVKKYEYDTKGNKIKYYIKNEKGKIICEFYKHDEYNRVIDILTTNGEDYNNSDILSREKYFYVDNLANTPYRIQTWNEKGELISDNYDVCFMVLGDTISQVSLDKENNITYIVRLAQKGNNLHRISYKIESDPTTTTYNYADNKLVSQYDSDGHSINYEYNKDELIKKTEELKRNKIITLYDNEQEKSITSYDNNNKVLWNKILSYEGNDKNGKRICKMNSKEDGDSSIETIYVNKKIAKTIETSKGITVTSEYTYNEHGDITEIKSTNGELRKYTYEYDPFGNWIKRISYNKDGLSYVTERFIEYF